MNWPYENGGCERHIPENGNSPELNTQEGYGRGYFSGYPEALAGFPVAANGNDLSIRLKAARQTIAFVKDDQSRYIYANQGFLEMLGCTGTEVLGRTDPDLPLPEFFRLDYLGGPPPAAGGDLFIHTEPRSGRIFEIFRFPVPMDHGRQGCGVFFREITERVRMEEALQFTRFAVDHLAEAAIWTDAGAKLVYVNDAACRLLQFGREELLRKTVFDLNKTVTRELWMEFWRELRSVKTKTTEVQYLSRQRTTTPLEIQSNFVAFGGREFNCAFIHDISARKRSEEIQRDNEQWVKTILQSVSAGVLVIQAGSRRIVEANRLALEMIGLPRDQVVGRECHDFICTADRGTCPVMDSRQAVDHAERMILASAGRSVPVLKTASTVQFRGEQYILESFLDISPLIQVEEERRLLERQLLQAQKLESIGRLAGGIAHDFNNILTGITGFSGLLRMRLHQPEAEILDYLANIEKAANQARDLTGRLLVLGRQQAPAKRPLHLNDLVAGFLKMLRRMIGEDVDLELLLDPNTGWVTGDATQLEMVLMNLSVNARDAMPGGGRLTIATGRVRQAGSYHLPTGEVLPGEYVILTVSDTGCGIDEEVRTKIFDPFFTTKLPGKGTGLGLSTVYSIIRQHDGHIAMESAAGQGTTFTIMLPAQPAGGGLEPGPREEQPVLPRGTETVLVVEDDDAVRRFMCNTLSQLGYEVLEAANGQQALRLVFEDRSIHLLVTDVIMPDLNGRQLFDEIAAIRPELRLLFVSGYTGEVLNGHGVKAQSVNFLSKPFTVTGFARRVRMVLDNGAGAAGHSGD